MLYYEINKPELGLKFYRKATDIGPANFLAYINLANAYHLRKNYQYSAFYFTLILKC